MNLKAAWGPPGSISVAVRVLLALTALLLAGHAFKSRAMVAWQVYEWLAGAVTWPAGMYPTCIRSMVPSKVNGALW